MSRRKTALRILADAIVADITPHARTDAERRRALAEAIRTAIHELIAADGIEAHGRSFNTILRAALDRAATPRAEKEAA